MTLLDSKGFRFSFRQLVPAAISPHKAGKRLRFLISMLLVPP